MARVPGGGGGVSLTFEHLLKQQQFYRNKQEYYRNKQEKDMSILSEVETSFENLFVGAKSDAVRVITMIHKLISETPAQPATATLAIAAQHDAVLSQIMTMTAKFLRTPPGQSEQIGAAASAQGVASALPQNVVGVNQG